MTPFWHPEFEKSVELSLDLYSGALSWGKEFPVPTELEVRQCHSQPGRFGERKNGCLEINHYSCRFGITVT